eukprot:6198268-Pleurochrysis_carterae.AAC.3
MPPAKIAALHHPQRAQSAACGLPSMAHQIAQILGVSEETMIAPSNPTEVRPRRSNRQTSIPAGDSKALYEARAVHGQYRLAE